MLTYHTFEQAAIELIDTPKRHLYIGKAKRFREFLDV